jgi:pyridoxal phosphate enzyme (YggS family)
MSENVKENMGENIGKNLAEIEGNIARACERAGRRRDAVTLVAVSKGQPPERIKTAYDAGPRVFGENRVQELVAKMDVLPPDIEWHLIGHLQRNKVKYVVGRVALIHSVDSLRLAEEISKEAGKRGLVQDILIEVNIAGEETKQGAEPGEVATLVAQAAKLEGLRVCGLMAIAPYVNNGEENRPHFSKLRELLVDIQGKNIDNENMGNFATLSMGMSGDYQAAIAEGATLVRIGTNIFRKGLG